MPNTPINDMGPSIAVTEAILTTGIYPSHDGGGSSGPGSIATIRHFAFNFAPSGTMSTSGQLLSIASNTAFFSLVGTMYGGNGTTTFAVPDLRTTLSVGEGDGAGLTSRVQGVHYGQDEILLARANMPTNLGGTYEPFDNNAPSMAVHYVINAYGTWSAGLLTDIGMIWEFAGNFAPAGTYECNGQLLSIADNDTLFAKIGTTYGGDGITTFALPDLRGRTIVGANHFDNNIGTTGGSETVTITANNLPTQMGHADVGFNNDQPSLVLTYMIALTGIFPSQGGNTPPDNDTPMLGEIVAYAGNDIPNGWALCAGQLLPINQNQALFALLGTTYGGNGTTNFALPDLSGRSLVGTDNFNIGQVLGSDSVSLTLDNIPDLLVEGTASPDTLYGANQADTILGYAGADHLVGYGGGDLLDGGAGADDMAGGTGSDTYIVDDSGDVTTELAGQGTDTVQSSASYALGANVENLTLTGSSAIDGAGNGLANVIMGNGAANVLDGGAGTDTLSYENAAAGVTISLALATQQNTHGAGRDTISGFENLTGSGFKDYLTGDSGNNFIDGGVGADRMYGGLGNDTYIVDNVGDLINEGTLAGGTDLVLSSVSYTLGANIENLTLTGSAAINGNGNGLANILIGNSGANTLDGKSGADTMSGGAGDDTYYVENAGDVVTELSGQGTDLVYSTISYTLTANVENLTLTGTNSINGTGNNLANTINGNDGGNILDGGIGADTLRGGIGNDTYIVDNAGDQAIEGSLASGADLVQASVSFTLGANIENLTLTGTAAIDGTGNSLDNTIVGNSGNNVLDGKAGADSMNAGQGDDTYFVDNIGDVVAEGSLGGGTDWVKSSVSFTLGANIENLTLIGGAAINGTGNGLDNVITGNSGANTVSGGSGADMLDGGIGHDILYGGTGNDMLIGGTGPDLFCFDTSLNAATNVDLIIDFTVVDDTIQLDNDVFTAAGAAGTLAANAFFTGAAAHDADDRLIYDSATGNIYYDADGNGAGAQVLFAQVSAGLTLTNADFFIVD